jgi:hypothetical protein
MTDTTRQMPFVQFEFTHALGPSPGRYVVNADGADDAPRPQEVLVIDVVRAQVAKRRRRRRGPAPLDPNAGPDPLALAVVTHVKTGLADDGDTAARWVHACEESPALQHEWIEDALAVVNVAIRAHRASCADPYFPEVTRSDPREIRIGHGTAPELAGGSWHHAFAVPAPRLPRTGYDERNAPSEVVAQSLGGHRVTLQTDELVLRALLDLDHGRLGCAALQLHAAARMLAHETSDDPVAPALATRLAARPELAAAHELDAASLTGTEPELQQAAVELRKMTDAWRAEMLSRFRIDD